MRLTHTMVLQTRYFCKQLLRYALCSDARYRGSLTSSVSKK